MLSKEESLLGRDERRSERERQVGRQSQGQQVQQGGRFHSSMAQMDRLFDEMFKRPFFSLWSSRMSSGETEELYAPIDIFEDGESVVVKAEIPGIRKEDIDIQLTPDSITISGQKRSEQRVDEKDFYRLERSYGSFTRSCRLPVECVTDRARAVFRDGVLEVRIPKSEVATQRAKKLTVE